MSENITIEAVNNAIEKLYVHMERTGQSMYALASSLGFTYQPFYRLMMKKSLPTINSLDNIATNFSCTVAELLDKRIFIDLPCFENFEDYKNGKQKQNIRLYVLYEQIKLNIHCPMFAIKLTLPNLLQSYDINNMKYVLNSNIFQIYIQTNKIDLDGHYWVEYKGKQLILEVLSVSSSTLIVNFKNQEIKIPVSEIKVSCKFFSFLEVSNHNKNSLTGIYK